MGKIQHCFDILAYARTNFTSEEIIDIREQNEKKLKDIYETENLTFINNTAADIGTFFTENKEKMTPATRYAIAYYLKSRFSDYNYIHIR
jgi:hypothetical protein